MNQKSQKKPKTIIEIRKENCDRNKIIKDLRAIYESKEDYYKPIKFNNAFNDNYIEYESSGARDKKLSTERYLNIFKPYLIKLTNDHKEEWKIQLTMEINFTSTKDSNVFHTMHAKSKNIAIFAGYETDKIV